MSLNAKEFLRAIRAHGANLVMKLQVAGQSETVLVKEIQRHPLTHEPAHIDFLRISLKEEVEVTVPVKVVGIAPGVEVSGGILEQLRHEVSVRCLPTAIPEHLEIDVSSLEILQSVKAQDLKMPEGVDLIIEPDAIIAHVVAPTKIEEPEVPAEGVVEETAEPEVIAKGKKPAEGEEGDAPGAKKEGGAPAGKKEGPSSASAKK